MDNKMTYQMYDEAIDVLIDTLDVSEVAAIATIGKLVEVFGLKPIETPNEVLMALLVEG